MSLSHHFKIIKSNKMIRKNKIGNKLVILERPVDSVLLQSDNRNAPVIKI